MKKIFILMLAVVVAFSLVVFAGCKKKEEAPMTTEPAPKEEMAPAEQAPGEQMAPQEGMAPGEQAPQEGMAPAEEKAPGESTAPAETPKKKAGGY
jgi:hypothetical protein